MFWSFHDVVVCILFFLFFFSSRRRHTISYGDWSSDVCSSDLRFESSSWWRTRTRSDASYCWSRSEFGAGTASTAAPKALSVAWRFARREGRERFVAFWCTCGATVARCADREPWTMPNTPATPTAAASTAIPIAGMSRRHGRSSSKLRRGGGSRARTRSRRTGGATGCAARNSSASFSKRSSTSSSGDTGAHLPFKLLQGAAESRRARRGADPEHAARALAVEVEHDAQREHLTL